MIFFKKKKKGEVCISKFVDNMQVPIHITKKVESHVCNEVSMEILNSQVMEFSDRVLFVGRNEFNTIIAEVTSSMREDYATSKR